MYYAHFDWLRPRPPVPMPPLSELERAIFDLMFQEDLGRLHYAPGTVLRFRVSLDDPEQVIVEDAIRGWSHGARYIGVLQEVTVTQLQIHYLDRTGQAHVSRPLLEADEPICGYCYGVFRWVW